MAKSARPAPESHEPLPFDGQTTTAADFGWKEGKPPPARGQAGASGFHPWAEPLSTTYDDAYLGQKGTRSLPARPPAGGGPPRPFKGGTTMKGDYVPHAAPKPARYGPDNSYKPLNEGPDERRTHYQATYVGPKGLKPGTGGHWMSDSTRGPWKSAPLDGATTNAVDFTPKALPAPVVRAADKAFEAQPFAGESTYTANFVPKDARVSQSARPVNEMHAPLPFDGQTTTGADFGWKEGKPPPARGQAGASGFHPWAEPLSTTYDDAYLGKKGTKSIPAKSLSTNGTRKKPFKGETEYYDRFGSTRRPLPQPGTTVL